jgi:hypothetical protein
MTIDAPEPEQGRRRLSRRTLIGGSIGVGALVALGAVAESTLPGLVAPQPGKLVGPLLKSKRFYVAHHGGSADWPEMSMKGYTNSVQDGVDGLEVSLARSSDGVWFGLHDATLDRTSGTNGFVAAEHSWDEIRRFRITSAATNDPSQPAQPYMRFDALVKKYATTHTIFVDPKSVSPVRYPELLGIMGAAVKKPTETFIAKFYCTGKQWAIIARAHHYKTWGFYYGADVDADPTLLSSTQQLWDILGMDYQGSPAAWDAALSYKKEVIGHIIPNRAAEKTAFAKGAAGLMISGISEVPG